MSGIGTKIKDRSLRVAPKSPKGDFLLNFPKRKMHKQTKNDRRRLCLRRSVSKFLICERSYSGCIRRIAAQLSKDI